MLCVVPHIREDLFKTLNVKHHIQVNNVINILYDGLSEKNLYVTIDTFWSEYKKSIIRMILLTVMNLSGVVNILVTEIVICGIINTIYHPPNSLVL